MQYTFLYSAYRWSTLKLGTDYVLPFVLEIVVIFYYAGINIRYAFHIWPKKKHLSDPQLLHEGQSCLPTLFLHLKHIANIELAVIVYSDSFTLLLEVLKIKFTAGPLCWRLLFLKMFRPKPHTSS